MVLMGLLLNSVTLIHRNVCRQFLEALKTKLNGKYRPNQRILWTHTIFFSRSVVVVANLIHFQSKFYDYGGFCRLQFLCMALDLCGKLAYPIFVFNSFMRSEPLLCASNRQSDQHRFSFVNISDAVIEFDEIMADGEICIQMCCGFSFMVFWIEIIYMYENVTWWLAHFARINLLFLWGRATEKVFFRFRDSYREWAHWIALRMTRTHCSYLLSLSRMYKCDVYASCIWIMLFFVFWCCFWL